jgi:glycosyltransferase involved in cell wall biosynthesis
MNMPSFYQDDLFSHLSGKVDLRVVYDHALTDDRRELGWTEVKSAYKSCVLEKDRKVCHAISIARSERDRVHVINGIWAETAFTAVAFVLGKASVPFAIYTECPDMTVSPSMVKHNARAFVGHWVGQRARGLLAVSHMAGDYFRALGFPKENIYPFGYFRASPIGLETALSPERIDLVYIGQLIRRKGVDLLLEAIKPLFERFPALQLSLIGTGSEQKAIESALQRDGLVDRVILEGVHPSSQIHQRLAIASALVLPSRWDGWGLVINEAFAAGVPVIASDRCGAADLVLPGVNGYRFRSESVEDLRTCLVSFCSTDRKRMRVAAIKTGSGLTIPVVTEYLVACLEHMCRLREDRPEPPWEQMLRSLESELGRLQSVATVAGADAKAIPSPKF